MRTAAAPAENPSDTAVEKPAALDGKRASRTVEGLRQSSQGLALGGIAIKALVEVGRS